MMRDLWRLLFAAPLMLGLFGALPAMADARTCQVDYDVGDDELTIVRTGDGSGSATTEFAYVRVDVERDAATPYWTSAGMIPGATPDSGALNLTLTFDAGGSPTYRWRITGASGTYEKLSWANVSLDWREIEARFANDTTVRFSVALDKPGAPVMSAGTLRLDDLRLALAVRAGVSAFAERLLADPASRCGANGDGQSDYALDCGERWEDKEGKYSTFVGQFEWERRLGDNVRTRFNAYRPGRDFDTLGFPPPGIDWGMSMLIFFGDGLPDAAKPHHENYPFNGRHEIVFSEIGSGDAMMRSVLGFDSIVSIRWPDLLKARGDNGDLPIALVHAQRGEMVRKLVPGTAFAHAERQLRDGWARRRERQWHPEQCASLTIEILTTDSPRYPGVAVPRPKRRR